MLKNNEEKTIQEKILKNTKIILNRLNNIEKKLDQLNDPFNIKDILSQRQLPADYIITNKTETTNEMR